MSFKDNLLAQARAVKSRVPGQTLGVLAFPEGEDERVITAAYQLCQEQVAEPLLIAAPDAFESMRKRLDLPEPAFAVLNPEGLVESTANLLYSRRKHKGVTQEQALVQGADRLFQAAALVASGHADGAVGGAVRTTSDTVRAAIQMIGPRSGIKTISSFFLMVFEDRCLLYADCGVIPQPSDEQLVDIAAASAQSWTQLTHQPARIAFLSFSTYGSASDPSIDVIRSGMLLTRERFPELRVDGEMQADAALIPEIGQRKAPGSNVAGQANVLIFPNLHAGNIAYKLTERLAGATALGPILQGLAWPMNDLSRGCNAEDIVLVSAITLMQANQVPE